MSAHGEVRLGRSGGARAVEVLTAAFADDPWLRWTLPEPAAARPLFAIMLRHVGPRGVLLQIGMPSDGVALLTPPGAAIAASDDAGAMVMALHGARLGPALDAEAVLDRHRPRAAGWVLHALAVMPSRRREGLGGRLLDACVARASATGDPLTLETSSEAARAWYLRRGFVEDARVALSDHGLGVEAPTVWLLSR